MSERQKVGITSTVPIEVLYAAQCEVIDLNNVFIADTDANSLLEEAERAGFPESSCSWIKGIYSVIHKYGIEKVIAVTQGDCSNTHALMETIELEGIETIPFQYPYDRDRDFLRQQIAKLAERFGVGWDQIGSAKKFLDRIRRKVAQIDQVTWQDGKVTGFENHYFQISCSDMKGDPEGFDLEVTEFLEKIKKRKPASYDLRLGYVGIPPILKGLYEFIEKLGARIVYNELQRQFAMPLICDDLTEQYLRYTYPYHVKYRLEDIQREVKRRRIDGVIHYVQSFCFRQIEDIILRRRLKVPVLTLEGNRPGLIEARTRMRIEAFLDMLRASKSREARLG